MKFYSTKDKNEQSGLKEAVLKGMASGKGLFMPESIPVLKPDFWDWLPGRSMGEIGFEVLKHFFCPDIPEDKFRKMVDDAFNFPVPVVKVSDNISVLELFHGPTFAFKDVGARFLARVMSYFADTANGGINVLVATSGDTGSAVAQGFYNVPGVNVHILYPSGLVSRLQELQFASLDGNITAYEVDGSFDDCQRMVKEAFDDDELKSRMVLTSANSINLARFLPQSVYYFYALSQIPRQQWKNMVVSVPSGNLGNLTAGLVAWRMGLPVKRFVASSNDNRVFCKFLHNGRFEPHPSVATIANAMDVGNPSNFERIADLFDGQWSEVVKVISGYSFSDGQIADIIKNTYSSCQYLLDPHGATAFGALQKSLEKDETGLFLATAHPAKFNESVTPIIGREVEIPEKLALFSTREKKSVKIFKDLNSLKACLLVNNGEKK
jgi:threonine synthase